MALTSHVIVTITEVLPAQNLVRARDVMGMPYDIAYNARPGHGSFARRGEQWVISRQYGAWMLARCVSVIDRPQITSSRVGAHPLVIELLEALDVLGLVEDKTQEPDISM